ncbi:Uncharacterised protein [Burkholderia pseudomallei]|nr:Uncharacterised protein [Burkholderia pseudomallei]
MYIAFIIGAFAVRDGARRNELEDFLQKILKGPIDFIKMRCHAADRIAVWTDARREPST